MTGLIGMVLNWLSGGLLDKVLGYFSTREKAKYDAMNDHEKLEYEDRRDARATMAQVRMATATFWEMRLITFVIALCFVSHLLLVTIDTNWPQEWNVPSFPKPFDEWEGIIILSFFGVSVAGSAIRSSAAKAVLIQRETTKRASVLEMMAKRPN